MSYYTTDVYETKKRNCEFLQQNLQGLFWEPTGHFVLDTQYGIARRTSILTTEIARGLDEGTRSEYIRKTVRQYG